MLKAFSEIPSSSPDVLNERLRKKVSLGETAAITSILIVIGRFALARWQGIGIGEDYFDYYLVAARGERAWPYGYWVFPVILLLNNLPGFLGYAVWNVINAAGIFFAARVFGTRVPLILLSLLTVLALFNGQVTGILLGGMALMWWGIANKKMGWAGLGLLFGACKMSATVPILGLMILFAEITWKERFKLMIVPVIGTVISFIVQPTWLSDIWYLVQHDGPNPNGSIALWKWIGPWALVFWLPPLVLPLTREQRFWALLATCMFGVPYLQSHDLLLFLVLPPFSWLPVAAMAGYFLLPIQVERLGYLFIIPMGVYFAMLLQWGIGAIKNRSESR